MAAIALLPVCDWLGQCCRKFCREPVDRPDAASIGSDNAYAFILDMSASALSKPLHHASAMPALVRGISCHARPPMPCNIQPQRRKQPQVAKPLLASDSPRAAVSSAVLIAALSLLVAGCGGLQSGTTAKTTLLAPADTRTTRDLAPAPQPPESPAKPAKPLPQNIQPISERTPPPATAAKGAERLVASTPKGPQKLPAASAPAPARATERTTLPAQPPDLKPPARQDSGTVTSPTVSELVFKGPPRQAPQPRAGMKALAWLGLAFGGGALAVLARLFLIRRAKPPAPSSGGKDDLEMPPELLFKESVIAPEEPAATEKP